jgi:hypothetical protein
MASRAEQVSFWEVFSCQLLGMNGCHAANGEFFLASAILLIVVVFSQPVSSV